MLVTVSLPLFALFQDQLESKVQEIMQVLKIDRPKAVIILKRVTMLVGHKESYSVTYV